MADRTKIEWTMAPDGTPGATWNPITGCSRVSKGCEHCYAERLAGTRMKHHPSRTGLTRDTQHGPVWTGEVRFNEEWLMQPFKWARPRRIFVAAHGDLFHENVFYKWLDRIWAVMALNSRHTFLVLTKRPEVMKDYLESRSKSVDYWEDRARDMGHTFKWAAGLDEPTIALLKFPVPNVWCGISAEDQGTFDLRRASLRDTPAAVRWISFEPLLGPIDASAALPALDWAVVGGESGPGSRPMHPDWARSLRDQCQVAGVPYFFKQWGDWLPRLQTPVQSLARSKECYINNPRGVYGPQAMYHVGKKAAGRMLDGRTWDQFHRSSVTDPIITVEHEVPPLCSRCKGASNELYYCRDCYRKWLQAYWRTEGPRLDIQDEDENAIFE